MSALILIPLAILRACAGPIVGLVAFIDTFVVHFIFRNAWEHRTALVAETSSEVLRDASPGLHPLMQRPLLKNQSPQTGVGPTADSLNPRLLDKVTHERAKWDEMLSKQSDLARSKDRVHPQAVARAVSDLARPDATFVFDTGLNTLWSANWIRQSGSQRIIGSFNNAAVGAALDQANGMQALDRSRQVIALTGHGEFNMLMGRIHAAMHHTSEDIAYAGASNGGGPRTRS